MSHRKHEEHSLQPSLPLSFPLPSPVLGFSLSLSLSLLSCLSVSLSPPTRFFARSSVESQQRRKDHPSTRDLCRLVSLATRSWCVQCRIDAEGHESLACSPPPSQELIIPPTS